MFGAIFNTQLPVTLVASCFILGMLHTDAVFDYASDYSAHYYYARLTKSTIMFLTLPVLIVFVLIHLIVRVVVTRCAGRYVFCLGMFLFFCLGVFFFVHGYSPAHTIFIAHTNVQLRLLLRAQCMGCKFRNASLLWLPLTFNEQLLATTRHFLLNSWVA